MVTIWLTKDLLGNNTLAVAEPLVVREQLDARGLGNYRVMPYFEGMEEGFPGHRLSGGSIWDILDRLVRLQDIHVFVSGYVRGVPKPHFNTLDLLIGATPVQGWRSREVTAPFMWQLFARQEPRAGEILSISKLPDVEAVRFAWAKTVGVGVDNHQTIRVRLVDGTDLYVTFHDGNVYIGTRLDS